MNTFKMSLTLLTIACATQSTHISAIFGSDAPKAAATLQAQAKKEFNPYHRYAVAQVEGLGVAKTEKCYSKHAFTYNDNNPHVNVSLSCPLNTFWGNLSENATLHSLYENEKQIEALKKTKERNEKISSLLKAQGHLTELDKQDLKITTAVTAEQLEKELKEINEKLASIKSVERLATDSLTDHEYFIWMRTYRLYATMPRSEYNEIVKQLREEEAAPVVNK